MKYVIDGVWRESADDFLKKIGWSRPARFYSRQRIDDTLMKLAKEDKRICFVAAEGLPAESYEAAGIHKYRVMGFGIAEANTVLAASGLAKDGLIPIYSNMSWLLGRSYNEIFQSVATDNLNVKFIMNSRGWAGGGGSHHEINDIAFMRTIPQILCMAPADTVELVKMIVAGVKYYGTTFIRVSGQPVPNLFEEDYPLKIGKAFTVREGDDVTIISFGIELWRSLVAADILAEKGIEARVVNMSTLKPLDEEVIIKAANETGAIVTAEDHSVLGGLGEAIASVVCRTHPVPMDMVGVRDRYSQSTHDKPGGWSILEEAYNLTANDIANAAIEIIKRK